MSKEIWFLNIEAKGVRSFVGQQWPECFFSFLSFLLHSEDIVLQMGTDLGHQSVSGSFVFSVRRCPDLPYYSRYPVVGICFAHVAFLVLVYIVCM